MASTTTHQCRTSCQLNAHDRSQVQQQPQPAQPDAVQLGQHRGARDLGRLRRHARRQRRLRAGGRRSGQHAVQRRCRSTSSTSASSAAIETSTTITLENQTELTAKFDTGPRRPHAADGHRPQLREPTRNKTFYPHRRLQRHPAARPAHAGCVAAGFTTGGTRRPTFRSLPGNYAIVAGLGLAAFMPTTRSR